jgi:hypothetical protein
MAKCEYEVTIMNRKVVHPEFEQKCSLTGHVCFCPEDYRQCVRREYAHGYEVRHAIKPQQGIPIPTTQD